MSEQSLPPSPNDAENKGFIVLKNTTPIIEEMEHHQEWKWLKPQYKKVKSQVGRSLCSIYNAIFFQRRIIFCLTRTATQSLVYHDKNHKKKGSFHNTRYRVLIACLISDGIVKMLYKGNGKRPAIYEVVQPFFLSALNGKSRDQQLQETITFVEQMDPSGEPQSEPQSEHRR